MANKAEKKSRPPGKRRARGKKGLRVHLDSTLDVSNSQPADSASSVQISASEGSQIAIVFGDVIKLIKPDDVFVDADQCAELEAAIAQAESPPCFRLDNLLSPSDGSRFQLLSLIARSKCPCSASSCKSTDPFEVILSLMEGDGDVARCERGRRAALEAAALFHGDALTGACSRIAKRLQSLRISGARTLDLVKEAKRLIGAFSEAQYTPEDCLGIPVVECLSDAPVSGQIIVPSGWVLTPQGVMRPAKSESGEHDQLVVSTPLLIVGRLTDVVTGRESVKLAWFRDAEWQSHIVDRKQIASTRTIVELAEYGLPITSNTAAAVVQYLADFEAANVSELPLAKVTSRLGWQGPTPGKAFLLGHTLITPEVLQQERPVSGLEHEQRSLQAITFRGGDAGDEQLADGHCVGGTFEGWQKAVKPLVDYPRVRLGIYAAFTATLLAILKSPNFVLDYCGVTSGGKTVAARIAASVFGSPDERFGAASMLTWDATRVYLERAPAVQCDLPLVVDDTKRARNPKYITQTIYDVASGRGRGRGSVDGLQQSTTFRSVMITTGEAPITSFTEDGGTRARVLALWGSPFGKTDQATGRVVRQINASVCEHFGHAGREFVTYLLANRKKWSEWRKLYTALRKQYEERAVDNPVVHRMATHFAAITTAATIAHEANVLPWAYADPIDELWDVLVAEASEADRSAAALRQVVSWAHAHQEDFHGPRKLDKRVPNDGWAGRWSDYAKIAGGTVGWKSIDFYPHKLRKILKEYDFEDYEAIIRQWRDRGFLVLDKEGKNIKAHTDDGSTRMVCISRKAISEVTRTA